MEWGLLVDVAENVESSDSSILSEPAGMTFSSLLRAGVPLSLKTMQRFLQDSVCLPKHAAPPLLATGPKIRVQL